MFKPVSFLARLTLIALLLMLAGSSAAVAADSDGDGVDDASDLCATSPPGAPVTDDGCAVADLCPCSGPEPGVVWKNHGQYVSCVTDAADQLADAGAIAVSDKGPIVREAARSTCGKGGQETVAVTVRTFFEAPDTPAADGVLIFVDGAQVGSTGPDGTLTVDLLAGQEHQIRALQVGLVGGRTSVTPDAAAGPTSVDIVMKGEEGVIERADLVIDGVQGRVLPSDFTSLALRFVLPDGGTAPLTFFDEIALEAPRDPDRTIEVTDLFTLDPSGRLDLADVETFRSALLSLPFGEVTLRAYGENDRGFVYSGSTGFFVGRYPLAGRLVAPPSNPGLAVDGLSVTAHFLQADVERTTVTDASGGFSFAHLPGGNWEISARTESGSLIYNGFATLSVVGGAQVSIVLRTTEDILNNVAPYHLGLSAPVTASADRPDRQEADAAYRFPEPFGSGRDLLAPTTSASVTAIAGSQGSPVSASDSLTVPQGTQEVSLTYEVASAEYPVFVLSQSVFNDVWSLVVVASNGGQLFQITRQVNSMIFVPPFWQPDGTTGLIEETLDVSGLTANGDAQIVLSASATNIGDSLLATGVFATADFQPELRIREVIPDTVTPTTGDSSYYSIPRPGQTNTFSRKYTLKISRPDNTTITNVKAELLRQSGASNLMTVVDEASGMLVTEVDDETLDVVVTMGSSNPSTVASTPPPVHNILHRFEVEGDVQGTTVSDMKDSNPRHALWKLPDTIARKPARDTGGDGWCAKGTYEWLTAHASLVPPVDDISGEHGRDIGHETHARGTDIDTYHFTNLLSGAMNGTLNYQRFRDLTVAALGGDAAARTTVTGWIEDSRDGLSNLAALNTVARLIYHRGAATSVLPNGWAMTLLEDGTLTDLQNRTLDLGIGTWSEAKVRFRNDHNNHLHIDLDDARLNNAP